MAVDRRDAYGQAGSPETTALVEPRAYTTGMMRAAEAHGGELRTGAVASLVHGPTGAVAGVTLDTPTTIAQSL